MYSWEYTFSKRVTCYLHTFFVFIYSRYKSNIAEIKALNRSKYYFTKYYLPYRKRFISKFCVTQPCQFVCTMTLKEMIMNFAFTFIQSRCSIGTIWNQINSVWNFNVDRFRTKFYQNIDLLYSHLRLCLQSVIFSLQIFRLKFCTHATCLSRLIAFDVITIIVIMSNYVIITILNTIKYIL
jgi:hypothetical protein